MTIVIDDDDDDDADDIYDEKHQTAQLHGRFVRFQPHHSTTDHYLFTPSAFT